MSSFFNYDNKFLSGISKGADSVILGILWFICSIPIITIGASSAAFYYSFNKSIRQKKGYAWKEFFHGFKICFKQSTIIWLILLALTFLLLTDCNIIINILQDTFTFSNVLLGFLLVFLILMTMWGLYLFPYLARFENRVREIMKNCMLIMLGNILWSILLLLLFVVAIVAFLLSPVLGIFVPAIYMLFANRILEHVFKKYMRPEDLQEQGDMNDGQIQFKSLPPV